MAKKNQELCTDYLYCLDFLYGHINIEDPDVPIAGLRQDVTKKMQTYSEETAAWKTVEALLMGEGKDGLMGIVITTYDMRDTPQYKKARVYLDVEDEHSIHSIRNRIARMKLSLTPCHYSR